MSVDLTKENPYVAVAAKKQRNLKKKLDKILKIEQNQQAGKALDQEQLILLNSKKSVEKALQDVAALKAQLEEVAKQELEGRTDEQQDDKEEDAQPQVEEDAAVTANVETNTDAQQQDNVAVSTMTEPVSEASKVHDEASRRAELEEKTAKLLKALHVYQRYKDVTTRNLPDTVDFFGRTLLGLTTISAFQGTLQHSARAAGYYLNDDLAAQNEVVRGCNYLQMSAIIDSLADEMEKFPPNRAPSSGTLTALLRNTISAPAMHPSEPTINLPPVPHVPPTQPELPIVAELSPTKFDLPQPQAVPQFVHIEAPSFGTLQFGEGFGSSAASLGRTEYATINFQSEPFFQLTPPLSASQPSVSQPPPQPQLVSLTHNHQPAVVQVVVEEPVAIVEQTVVVEIESAPVEGNSSDAKNEAAPEEAAAEGEKSGSPRNPRHNNNNRDRRNNRFNRRDEKDGAEGEGDKRGGSNRHRRKFDQKDENAAATANNTNGEEVEGKQPYKKRSYRFDRNKNESGEFHTGGDAGEQKDGKDFNYAKKFNKRDGKKEAAQTEQAAAPAAAEEPVKSEAPVKAEAPAPAAEPVEAPKPAAPVKRSSYQDAVRANLALPEEPAAEKETKKKPFVKKTDDNNNEADNKAPRRDRSNNRVPRDRDNQNNNNNNNSTNDQGEPRERKPFNNNFNRQGGERKNFDNKPRFNNNNTNNNNNNRTVNNNQTVRRPAQPKAEAPANA